MRYEQGPFLSLNSLDMDDLSVALQDAETDPVLVDARRASDDRDDRGSIRGETKRVRCSAPVGGTGVARVGASCLLRRYDLDPVTRSDEI